MSPLYLLAILPAFLWAVVNHIDKYAIERYMQGRDAGALVIFTGSAAAIMGAVIWLLGFVGPVPAQYLAGMISAGVLLILSYVPYLYALDRDEASNVGPLFQMITPISYVLALVFLSEHLALPELLSGGMIFAGAILLSFDFKKVRIKMRSLLLMLLGSLMIGLNVVMFKAFALETSFWTMAFYDLVGAALGGALLFFLVRSYRVSFIGALRQYRHKVFFVNMTAETLSIFARLLNGFVALFLPIAIVQFVNGFQPLFILIIGILLTAHAPHLGKEAIDRHSLIQKFSAIILMIGGFALLSFFV